MEVGCPGAWGLVPLTQTQVEHPISQPYLQLSQETCLANTAPALAPITLRPEIQWKKLYWVKLWGEGGGEH